MKYLKAKLSLAAAMLVVTTGATAAPSAKSSTPHTPMVLDWSSRQTAFRDPQMPEEARSRGTFARWQRLASDPRYMLALAAKLRSQADSASPATASSTNAADAAKTLARDWSNVLGGGTAGLGGTGIPGVYPAKFNFDINAVPTCNLDFVVYPTGAMGRSVSGLRERWVADFDTSHSAGTLTLGKVEPRTVTLIGSTTRNDGVYVKTGGAGVLGASTLAANLAAGVNRWNGRTGFSAVAEGPQVSITLDTAGNQSVDYVDEQLTNFGPWFNQDGTPDAGMPSIIAFNWLYNGTCSATRRNPAAPNVAWAHNTGGLVRTSPVLSFFDDAGQVAFVQSVGGQAELVLLRTRDNGDGRASVPTTPATAATVADYRARTGACAADVPCMFKFPLGADDTWSSPFVDYFDDVLYVGTDNGVLHKFTGVFIGTPAEVVTGGFPATVSAGNSLSAPVYNFNGSIYIGSASIVGSGGALHRVNTATGAVVSSAKLTANTVNPGIRWSPLLDVSSGHVYAFLFNDGGGPGTNCTAAPCRAVVDFAANFAAGSPGNKTLVGSGNSNTRVQYNGAFDSVWYHSADSTGSMYICGGAPDNVNQSVLWKIPITGGVLGTPLRGATVSGILGSDCSQVTDVQNGDNEYLYFSMADNGDDGAADACTGPCLYLYKVEDLGDNVRESWTFDFTANETSLGGTLVVNGTTLTAGNVQACPTFDVTGPAILDATRLENCIDTVPGYSGNRRLRSIVVSRDEIGDVPDSTVQEGVNMVNFSQDFASHVNGSENSAWGPGNIPAAGIPAVGGTSGIIIDNTSALPGASQIYFANVGIVTGNAVQASQDELR